MKKRRKKIPTTTDEEGVKKPKRIYVLCERMQRIKKHRTSKWVPLEACIHNSSNYSELHEECHGCSQWDDAILYRKVRPKYAMRKRKRIPTSNRKKINTGSKQHGRKRRKIL